MPVTFVCSIVINRSDQRTGGHRCKELIHVSLQKLARGQPPCRKALGPYLAVRLRVFLRRGVSLVNIFHRGATTTCQRGYEPLTPRQGA